MMAIVTEMAAVTVEVSIVAEEVEAEAELTTAVIPVEEGTMNDALMIGAGAAAETMVDGARTTGDRIVGTTIATNLALRVTGSHQLLLIILPTIDQSRSPNPTKMLRQLQIARKNQVLRHWLRILERAKESQRSVILFNVATAWSNPQNELEIEDA